MTKDFRYRINFKPSVEKDLKRVSKHVIAHILKRIAELATNPFPSACLKLTGAERLYRIRVGDYRIIYEMDSSAKVVTIHYVRHRRDVYRLMA